ncbi:hypothetical protein [Paenibacillus sp. UNC499MF]|uniref:hypothetical protein n=1 Tax=Paenibacillus sp. UNC499MF TaxID=1502751 RepID=UPI00089FCD70|nr:hypothetical protein [Paenibacillus sp. UNC499MF]SEG26370.1 hypothetical protein SAMN02799616_02359 [Paenibacillus sp. UNC499MF]
METQARFSQKTAILLERVRRLGLSDEVLLASAASGDVKPLQEASGSDTDYEDFFVYGETHGEQIAEGIRNGYRMKFNTIGGLQTWLKERLGRETGTDFTASVGRIDGLSLTADEAELLGGSLASNWLLREASLEAEGGADQASVNENAPALSASGQTGTYSLLLKFLPERD